jgi:PTH1 family peptidyl-tRNA hydrolase
MHLLAGLGNPGLEYKTTRHNYGFIVLDEIILKYGFEKSSSKKFSSDIFFGEIFGKKIIALKPKTYMNLSGLAILEAINFYKIPSEKIIVFHDEVDLELSRIKVKQGGGSAGHNGIKSIDHHIGREYVRVRLGVSKPAEKNFIISDYVLSKFSDDEKIVVKKISSIIAGSMPILLDKKYDEFMNYFCRHTQST